MSTSVRTGDQPGIAEVDLAPRRAPVGIATMLGVLGIVEVLVVFVALQSRLPGQVPVHFGFGGPPNGWETPIVALELELVEVAAISFVFIVMQWWIARSTPLTVAFGGRLVRPLLAFQAVIVVGILPVVSGLLFASAAGVLGISGAPLGDLFLALGVGSAALILVVLGLYGRHRIPTVPGSTTATTQHARFAVGGPIELSCPACGERYHLNGVPLFVPHLGVGRVGSLYVRCPRCGERGWNTIVALVAA
jgi:hypothetical protein